VPLIDIEVVFYFVKDPTSLPLLIKKLLKPGFFNRKNREHGTRLEREEQKKQTHIN
jgi:hypothetical protein